MKILRWPYFFSEHCFYEGRTCNGPGTITFILTVQIVADDISDSKLCYQLDIFNGGEMQYSEIFCCANCFI